MYTSNKTITIALMLAAIAAIGIGGVANTYADINTRSAFIQTDKGVQLKVIGVPGPAGKDGNDGGPGATGATGAPGAPGKDGTTLDNKTLADVNSLSANFAVFQQILQAYQNGSLQGKDGQNGRDGTNGSVTFICFDANNQTMVCPFTQIPNSNQTIPPVVNETTPPVDNGTVIPPVTNETGTGGDNSTIPVEPPVDNTTTTENTTTTTNTTTTENGTTTETNSTSETVPTSAFESFSHALGF